MSDHMPKPKRRACDHNCPHWLRMYSTVSSECRLRPGCQSWVRSGDKCRADAGALRGDNATAGWEADELNARGLKP